MLQCCDYTVGRPAWYNALVRSSRRLLSSPERRWLPRLPRDRAWRACVDGDGRWPAGVTAFLFIAFPDPLDWKGLGIQPAL